MSRSQPVRSSWSLGFTLLEVLIALTIMGILLTTIYGAVSRTIRTKDHAEASARMSSTGREAVMRLADEIETSLAPAKTVVAGAFSPVFQGVNAGSGQFLDQARFTISSRPAFGPIGGSGGRVVVTYYLADQEGAPLNYLLVRSEISVRALTAQQDPQEDSPDQPQEIRTLVTDNVAGLRLRYLDGNDGQWSDNWDSVEDEDQAARLPIAVEIALFLNDETGSPHEFSTVVDLPLGTKPTPTPGHG